MTVISPAEKYTFETDSDVDGIFTNFTYVNRSNEIICVNLDHVVSNQQLTFSVT